MVDALDDYSFPTGITLAMSFVSAGDSHPTQASTCRHHRGQPQDQPNEGQPKEAQILPKSSCGRFLVLGPRGPL